MRARRDIPKDTKGHPAPAEAGSGIPRGGFDTALLDRISLLEAEVASRTAELRKSEERFLHTMRGTNEGVWDWDMDTNEVYYSPRWKGMLGYSDDELANHFGTWESLVHPDDRQRVLGKVGDYIAGRSNSYEVEMRMIHKDGHEIVVLSRGSLILEEGTRRPLRLVGTHIDITARTKSEQFILATSEIMRMIATRQPAGAIYDAIAHLYESRHRGMRCSMLILSGNRLLHAGAPSLPKAYCDAVNGLENGPDVGSCGTSTYTGKRVLVENIETDPKWAKIKHVALPNGMRCCWSEPIKNSSGEVLGAFGMYYNHPALPNESESADLASAARLAGIIMEREKSAIELVTYKNHLEELVDRRTRQLEEAKREAEEANNAKSKFLSNMSHELRTPLNAIIGFAELLMVGRDAPLPAGQRDNVGRILDSGRHLLQIVTDILNVSEIEAGRVALSPKPVRVGEMVREVAGLVRTLAEERQVTLVHDGPEKDSGGPHMLADRLRLKQILLNLVSNGIKYNKPGGTVAMRVIPGAACHRIVVEDTGVGMDERAIRNLFEPFNRLGAETGNIEGTGIGLAITKLLTEVMDGSLAVESTPGKGTAFTVTLPAAPASRDETHEDACIAGGEISSSGDSVKTVLCIDDNEVNIMLIGQVMRLRPNIRFLAAATGEEGVRLALEERPALLFIDMHLPDMTGIEVLAEIKRRAPSFASPAVGLSADAMPEVIRETLRRGFADYITKPFTIDRLLKAVDSIP